MAARLNIRRSLGPAAAGVACATVVFSPRRAYAESPEAQAIPKARKPIYDEPTRHNPPSKPLRRPSDDPTIPGQNAPSASTEPTPTDRLQIQVRRARLGLYDLSTSAEASLNRFLTRAFSAEHDFTNTVRSLAPPAEANEPLLPGFVYILVATLSGSILARNRGVILRFSVPLAFGIGAARATLPYTSRNVGDLIWKYEERYPEVAKAHLQARERIARVWETGKAHTQMSVGMLEDKVVEARDKAEDWVKQGK